MEQHNEEHVSFTSFVHKFDLSGFPDALSPYETLINSTEFKTWCQKSLNAAHHTFKHHSLHGFWSSCLLEIEQRETKTIFNIVTTKTAIVQNESLGETSKIAGLLGGGGNSQDMLERGLSERCNKKKQNYPMVTASLDALPSSRLRTPSLGTSDSESYDNNCAKLLSASFLSRTSAEGSPANTLTDILTLIKGQNSTVAPDNIENDEFTDPTRNLLHFEALNQTTSWICQGTYVLTMFHNFRAGNLGPFSLVLDGIAGITPESSFSKTLLTESLSSARENAIILDINAKWPTLQGISERDFKYNTYEHIAEAVRTVYEHYIKALIPLHSDVYFDFHSEIPKDLNEREGFTDLTWSFIRGALTLNKIESRHLEVLVTGVQDRKNHNRNPFFDTTEVGQCCGSLALSGKDQIYLAETSRIQNVKADKRYQDQYKLVRELRDSWLSQMKSICQEAVPPCAFAVFGSCTYKDETKMFQFDFQGTFRLEFDKKP
ncbi:hypothetical protein FBU30_001139 [Linnemannia zychae]|nr:hypothetical protein FBU30_001139 [Linnemannia zychae]